MTTSLSAKTESRRIYGASAWVLGTVDRRYRLQFQFQQSPQLMGVGFSHARGNSTRILQEEILSLLMKGPI